jgi:O-methyltransferase
MPNPKVIANNFLTRFGYRISKVVSRPPDVSEDDWQTYLQVKPYTLTSPERILTAIQAARHIVANRIPGDVVECGVWKGGSSMALAKTLVSVGDTTRRIFMYDTFSGMSEPTEQDRDPHGNQASVYMRKVNGRWCDSPLDEVRQNMETAYPIERVVFVPGKVEDTIPLTLPERIAILRLDTDWYESTAHELKYLWPLLERGGVLIIDDYGEWQGARKAVDEYFKGSLFLARIDYTGRVVIKA